MNRQFLNALILTSLATLPTAALSQDHGQDQAEIRNVEKQQQEAWNQHDAKAYANLFMDDGEVVNVVGWWWKGKAEIEKKLTDFSFFFFFFFWCFALCWSGSFSFSRGWVWVFLFWLGGGGPPHLYSLPPQNFFYFFLLWGGGGGVFFFFSLKPPTCALKPLFKGPPGRFFGSRGGPQPDPQETRRS